MCSSRTLPTGQTILRACEHPQDSVVTYINDVKLEKLVGIDETEIPFEAITNPL